MASTGNHTERKMCRVKVNRLFVKEIYTFWQNLSKPDFRKKVMEVNYFLLSVGYHKPIFLFVSSSAGLIILNILPSP